MTWVLPEIVIPLLVAIGLGVLIGWFLWKWRRRSIHASEWNQLRANTNQAKADVAAVRAAYEEANNERSMLATEVGSLTKDLTTAHDETSALSQRADSLAADVEIGKSELAQANDALDQLALAERSATDEEVARLRDELAAGALRRSQLEQAVEEFESGAAAAALMTDRVDDAETKALELEAALAAARTELDTSQSRIADFDARLSTTDADLQAAHQRVSELEERARADDLRVAAIEPSALPNTWAVSEDIGISRADHVDDLKVISGIGPRMEELLTTLGITSWEQLADLDDAGVARVDGALMEFPGRITRDEWVNQARDLVSRFPEIHDRPTRQTVLNRTKDEDPFN